jgi:hypothetical protein
MGVLDRPLEAPDTIRSAAVAWCARCGLALSEDEIQRNLALVLARCCPRCDGPLKDRVPPPDAAVYLG